jgi:signal transduction histidine kinase
MLVMERRRAQIVLQLAAVLAAGVTLAVFQHTLGLVPTLVAVTATMIAGVVGVSSLRGLAHATRVGNDARRLKTELLSNVSHELRTPLNAILGYAEVLDTMPEIGPGERQQIVGRILSNAVTLTCAVNNLLEYSTVAAGNGELRPGTVRLAELFDELEPWVSRLIDEKPIAFTWSAAPNLPVLEIDRSKLRQVVLNLLANSVKFTAAGEIRLSARLAADDAGVEIAVCDTGVGMTPGEQTHIFDDFRQGCGSTTRPFGGIGLGLTLVRRLCDLLGGSIAVESAPAKGTRVAIRLPATAPQRQNALNNWEALRASA